MGNRKEYPCRPPTRTTTSSPAPAPPAGPYSFGSSAAASASPSSSSSSSKCSAADPASVLKNWEPAVPHQTALHPKKAPARGAFLLCATSRRRRRPQSSAGQGADDAELQNFHIFVRSG